MENKIKPSKTILIFKNQDYNLPDNIEINNKFTSNNGNVFIEANTISDSENIFKSLKEQNLNIKYSYYNIFFRLYKENLNDLTLDNLNELLSKNLLLQFPNITIINTKFFTKGDNYMGSGYFIVDTFSDYNTIIQNRTIKLDKDEELFNFYPYQRKK